MADRYQSGARKSTRKFEMLGKKELAMTVPLPLVEVWEELQPQVEQLTGMAGLKIIQVVIEDEVTRRVSPRYQPDAASSCVRAATEDTCSWKIFSAPAAVRSRTCASNPATCSSVDVRA